MLKGILVALAALVAIFLIIVALQPSQFRIERTATIDAPPPAVFAQVNDLHNFQKWSPWAKRDPAATTTFTGPPAGTGASFAWAGNKDVGEGRMTITDSRPSQLVTLRLEFLKPFAATNTAEFAFKPDGTRTDVTWSMYGPNNFVSKALRLFMDIDKLVGNDFETGLANLKSQVEADATRPSVPPP